MKTKIFVLTLILLLIYCTSATNFTKTEKNLSQGELSKVSYSEITRGTRNFFTFTPLTYKNVLNEKETEIKMSADQWQRIKVAVSELDINKISTYKSPTTKRFSDGAKAAKITIEMDGKEYSSAEFDAGNAPAQLQKLYTALVGERIIKVKK